MSAMNKDPLKWGRYAAIAGAYAACYELTRYFSFSHWILPAGLRLACLLLVPRRFWPALAIGETLPIAEMAILTAHRFGAAWAMFAAFPPIVLCMPFVAALQQRTRLVKNDGEINIPMILVATMLCALMNSAGNAAALAAVVMPDGSSPGVAFPVLLVWFLGAYLGALTLTPVVLAFQASAMRARHGELWKTVIRSRLARDTVLYALPTLLVMMWLSETLAHGPLQAIRIGMALPAVVLTARYGWQGGALGGMLGSIALAATATTLRDPSIIQAQVVLALVISTSLLFGVNITRRIAAVRPTLVGIDGATRPEIH